MTNLIASDGFKWDLTVFLRFVMSLQPQNAIRNTCDAIKLQENSLASFVYELSDKTLQKLRI